RWRLRSRVACQSAGEGNASRSHEPGSIKENELVDNVRFERGAIDRGPGFDDGLQDLAAPELGDHRIQANMAAAISGAEDFDAGSRQSAGFRGPRRLRGEDEHVAIARPYDTR